MVENKFSFTICDAFSWVMTCLYVSGKHKIGFECSVRCLGLNLLLLLRGSINSSFFPQFYSFFFYFLLPFFTIIPCHVLCSKQQLFLSSFLSSIRLGHNILRICMYKGFIINT